MSSNDLMAVSDQLAVLTAVWLEGDAAGTLDITPSVNLEQWPEYAHQLEQLLQQVEALAEPGALQAILFFIWDQVQQFSALGRPLTAPEQTLLVEWPLLTQQYLQDPHNLDSVSALLDFFQQPDWPAPLPLEEAERFLSLLVPDITPAAAVAVEQTGGTDTPAPGAESLAERALNMVSDLLEIIADFGAGGEVAQQALMRYAAQMELLAHYAEQANIAAIQAIAMIIHEQIQQFASLERPLSTAEQELLEAWPALLMSYIENPDHEQNFRELLAYLKQPLWLKPLPDDEAEMLLTLWQPDIVREFEEESAQEPEQLEKAEFLEPLEPPLAQPVPAATTGLLTLLPLAEKPTPYEANIEMVALMQSEADTLLAVWDELLAQAAEAMAAFDAALETYAEQLERMAGAAEAVSLTGVQHFFVYLHALVTQLRQLERPITLAEKQLLQQWPVNFRQHLSDLTQQDAAQALVAVLQDPAWPVTIDAGIAAQLITDLTTVTLTQVLVDEAAVPRQTTATAQEVSLVLPADVSPELLEGLLTELPHQTADFSAAIQRIVSGQGSQADVDIAKRIAHTLKGAANTVGIPGIAHLTHHIEDILIAFTKHGVLPSGALANMLVNAADILAGMSESLLGVGEAPELSDRLACLQEVLDWANQIDKTGIPTEDSAVVKAPVMPAVTEAATESAAAIEQTVPTLRVDVPLIDHLLRLSGESIILSGQIQEKITQLRTQSSTVQQHTKMLLQLSAELEYLIDVQDVFNIQHNRKESGFDALEFDHYNEVHTYIRRLMESANDAKVVNQTVEADLRVLESMLAEQQRHNRENQDAVLRTRMIPVHSISPRLQRGVRQTCRLLDKTVQFTISGEQTLVDSDMLSALVEPIMHLLRNAIDHGIEDPEHRQLLGKPAEGHIRLSFALEGDHIAVVCQDDGRGMDPVLIRQKALALGFITPEVVYSDKELLRLILRPGFSTKESVSQTSGRGIGMDVVATRIQELKGAIEIDSMVDEGTTLRLSLPLTLAAAHALLIRSHRQVFAVVNRGIEQIVYHGSGQLQQQEAQWFFTLDEQTYEAKPLEWLINVPMQERRSLERQARPLLMVRTEGTYQMVMVESVLDSRDIVVKPLGPYLPPLRGIIGATILGDGSVAPVLDLAELLRGAKVPAGTMAEIRPEISERHLPCALVVDDSLSARRALEQLVQDMGLEVRAARDGLEAVDVIRAKRPDIILVDLEMPRMNGLELAEHVRAQPQTQDIPIIMITSRSTEKHRQLAQAAGVNLYLTKPFAEDELMARIQTMLQGVA